MNILEKMKNSRLYFDGGTGSELIKRGLEEEAPSEEACFSHPEWVVELHRAYINAGANIIKTNTFGVNPKKQNNYREYIERAVSLANEARGGREDVFVALDIGPLGRMLSPFGDLDFLEAVELFARIVRAAEGLAVDLILIETMSDSYETKAAVLAAKENSSLPIFVTNVYDGSGKTLTGGAPETMANMLEGLGVQAIGANCSFGPREMFPVAERLLKATSLPVIINPNAGLPRMENGSVTYTEDAESFSDIMVEMSRLGVSVLGGCCGTTPDHIRRTKDKTEGIPLAKTGAENRASSPEKNSENRASTPENQSENGDSSPEKHSKNTSLKRENYSEKTDLTPENPEKRTAYISSAYTTIPIGKEPLLIGERINPTGKRWLKEELQNNRISKILAEAVKQEECGISAVDVNCGLPKLDEKAKMRELVHEIQSVISLPIVIDSSDPEVIEAAARIYNGAPLINSVNGTEDSLARVLPIAKKYGGALICLTMDERGIPETVEERIEVAEKILSRAEKMGIGRERLLFDPLALSVSTDEKNADITLSSIRALTARGLYSSLGVSNISFGMPNREKINSAFFRLALAEGLSAAIMNPESEEMMRAYRDFLTARESEETLSAFRLDAEKGWASALSHAKEITSSGVDALAKKSPEKGSETTLKTAIIKGLRREAAEISERLLESVPPMDIINGEIIPALTVVGEAYDKKEIFLPGLLLSAEAAGAAFDAVKVKISRTATSSGRIIMATVKGDIHDIGKNIVRVVLESWGFTVCDLGRDVPKEKILQELEGEETLLVGLSALMTTTLPAMEETVRAIKEKFPKVKIMVGGAVLTADYAERIGADFYGKDAPSAAKIANSLIGRDRK
ncbi:MAG: homocysteine S-methyltransferase family protein [Clostridia bacterium]|nr:homocysteine S-methyltransferase family protein [Clostridia bacterium]